MYLRCVDDILAAFDNEQDLLNFLDFLNKRHPNIKFTIRKQINHSIAFLNVFISGINNQNLTLQTYHRSTYIWLLLNLQSFTSFSYKISLIKCLIHCSFEICNNWNFFHNDMQSIKSNFIKMSCSSFLIEKPLEKSFSYEFPSNKNHIKHTSNVHHFTLLCVNNLPYHIKNKLLKLCEVYFYFYFIQHQKLFII